MVVADHERDRSVIRDRHVERRGRLLHADGVRSDGRDGLVEVEVPAAREPEPERGDGEERDQQDPAEQPEPARSRRRRLAVPGDGTDRPRRKYRLTVPVCTGTAPDASLHCRPHKRVAAPLKAPAVEG